MRLSDGAAYGEYPSRPEQAEDNSEGTDMRIIKPTTGARRSSTARNGSHGNSTEALHPRPLQRLESLWKPTPNSSSLKPTLEGPMLGPEPSLKV